MYRRERLHDEQFRHPYAAGLGDAADIVAQQIDDHQIFSAVLGRIGQTASLCGVLFCVRQPRQRALDRAGLDTLLLQP